MAPHYGQDVVVGTEKAFCADVVKADMKVNGLTQKDAEGRAVSRKLDG